MRPMKSLEQRLATAEACYFRNMREADRLRGADPALRRFVRRYERAAESAWRRVDSLRYQIARAKSQAPQTILS